MKKDHPEIYVIGLGYVGLTLAVTLARAGLRVNGIDKSDTVIKSLQNGSAHFYEKELDEAIREVIGRNLNVATSVERGDRPAAFLISVGTPVDMETKKPILTQIDGAVSDLSPFLRKGDTVILRSTVPVGTSKSYVLKRMADRTGLVPGEDLFFAFAPERTVEGQAMAELRSLPQIVGGYDERSAEIAASIFRSYNEDVVIMPDIEHAEMLKVLDNSYRDILFSYANQMALICENMNLDFSLIREAANYNYPRNNIPMSSPGVGGACLTKDPYLLIDICKKKGINHQLVSAGRELNEYIPVYLANQLLTYFTLSGIDPKRAKVFILGIAFKGRPPTSDTRFSSTIDFSNALSQQVPNIWVSDPHVKPADIAAYGLTPCSLEAGFREADAVIAMTNHELWGTLNLSDYKNLVHRPCLVLDHWNILPHKTADDPVFRFFGFGMRTLAREFPKKMKLSGWLKETA